MKPLLSRLAWGLCGLSAVSTQPALAQDYAVVVGAGSPYQSIGDIIRSSRSAAAGVTCGAGRGTPGCASFAETTGARVEAVLYKGTAPMVNDIADGSLGFGVLTIDDAKTWIGQGKLRALAVSTTAALASLPGAPTLAQAVATGAREDQKQAAAQQADFQAKLKSNSVPTLADVQKIVLDQSMALSAERDRSAKGRRTSATRYEMTVEVNGQAFKTATVTLEVSKLRCKPEAGMQRCTYTESFDWTRYTMFENVVTPKPGRVDQRSTLFKWTPSGLSVEGEFETRSVGWSSGDS